jgi:growth factor receptor-binding protein 2
MEAIAKHDFQATANDELSFPKGAKLKIINTDDDKNWYKAELNGRIGFIPSNYVEMKPAPWYVGRISRDEARAMLLDRNDANNYSQKDGAFLVRNSETGGPEDFSITVKFGDDVQHFKVLKDGSKYFLWQVRFDSLNELIKYHRTASVSRTQTIYLQDMMRSKVIANYDFKPENTDEELELKRGDIVAVLNKNDPNWWMGEVTRGNQIMRGLFPKTYVSPYID